MGNTDSSGKGVARRKRRGAGDVTKHKRVELKREESVERLSRIVDSSPDAITVTDLNGNIIECNQATLDVAGFSKKEVLGKSAFDFFAPKDRQRAAENMEKTLKQGTVKDVEYTLLARDGREYQVELSTSLIRDASGNPSAFVAIMKDISERKQMEDALKASEKKYSTIVERGSDGIVIVQDGVMRYVNPKLLEISGFSLEETIGRSFIDFMSPEYKESVLEMYKRRLKGEEAPNRYEIEIIAKNGNKIQLEINASPIEHEGRPADMAIVRDITERKRMEEQLRESEERFRGIAERSFDAIFTTDLEGRATHVSPAIERIFGYRPEEMIGTPILNYVPESEIPRATQSFTEVLKGKIPKDLEFEVRRKDGSPAFIEISASLIVKDGGKIGVQGVLRDITERKQAAVSLKEAESKLRSILSSMVDLVFVFDKEGKFVFYQPSRAVGELYVLPEAFLGRKFSEVMPPHIDKPLSDAFDKSKRGEVAEFEYWLEMDGETKWYSANLSPMLMDGEFVGSVAVVRNITERKQMEEALRKSEEKYRTLVENASDLIYMIDEKDKVLSLNKAAAMLFGRRPEEVVGKSIFDLFPKEVADGYSRDLKEVFRTGESQTRESKMVAGGRESWINTTLNPVRDPEGKVVAVIGVTRDITQRKQMEEALRESEEKHRAIVENSPNFVFIIQEGAIQYANKAMCEALSWTVEEFTAPSFNFIEKLIPQQFQALVKENLAKRLSGESIPPYEIYVKTRDGSEIPVIVRAQMIPYHGKPAVVFILGDITERKRAEAERMKIIEDVARSIAHDVRNPLSAIRTATYLLRDEVGEKGREMLELIDRNILVTDNIIMNLRDLSTPPPIQPSPTNLNRLLKEATDLTIIPTNVKLSTHYGEIPQAEVDEKQFTRVFSNIVMNAVQAMPNGGELTITTNKTDNSIEIKIKDTGVGIPPENLAKLFTPFFTTKAKGTGLGLITAKRMVEAHGGTLTVESEEGKGTTITVRLPPNPQPSKIDSVKGR